MYVRSETRIGDKFLIHRRVVQRWRTSESGTELVTSVLKGLRQQLQDAWVLSINAFEPRMTGHDLQEWKENHVGQCFDVDGSTVGYRASKTGKDQGGSVLAHVPSVRES